MHCDLTSHLESSVQYHLLVLTQNTVEQNQTTQRMQRKVSLMDVVVVGVDRDEIGIVERDLDGSC
jgi:hypothetical protein